MNMIKINIKISLALIITMLWVPLVSVRAQGNLVLNGTFDSNLSEWTSVNTWWLSDTKGGGVAALYATASLSQTIDNLDVGTTYIVSGDYFGATMYNMLEVSVDGFPPQFYWEPDVQLLSWQNFSFSFIANSSTVTLEFINSQTSIL